MTEFKQGTTFRLVICLCLLASMLIAGTAWGQHVVVGNATTEIDYWLERSESTVQDGPELIDQFKFVRLQRKNMVPGEARAVLFLLPALGVDFTAYESTAPRRNSRASIVGFFAQRNIVVYGLGSRMKGLPAGGCEAGVIDCSPMADWNLQTMVDDIAFVRSQIAIDDPGLPVFVGGHSLGGIAALAAVNEAPTDYDGLIVIEGLVATDEAAVQALNQGYCVALENQLAAGLVYEGFGNNLLKKISTLSEQQPDGLTSIPLFPGFLTNRQVLAGSLVTPPPGPASMPVPGYVLANGNPMTGELFHVSDARLYEDIGRFDDYAPLPLVRDISCSLAGIETDYSVNLGAYTGPALGIGGALGFGPYIQGNLEATGSTDLTVLIEPGFGHIDHMLAADHRMFIERPIYQWMNARLP